MQKRFSGQKNVSLYEDGDRTLYKVTKETNSNNILYTVFVKQGTVWMLGGSIAAKSAHDAALRISVRWHRMENIEIMRKQEGLR